MTHLERRNFFHLVMDIFWFGVAMPATTRFIAVYALRVDATAQEVALIAAVPAFVLIFSSGLGAWFQRFVPDVVHAASITGFGFRLAFFLPVFTPLFPLKYQPWWLILAVTIPALSQGIGMVTFFVMMRESITPQQIVALTARRSMAANIAIGASTFALGLLLTRLPFPYNYQAMFLLASFASAISLWHVSRVRVLPATMPVLETSEPTIGDIPKQSPWKDSNFSSVIFATFISHVSFFAVFPLLSVYLVDSLGHDEGFVAIFMVVELGASALISAVLPKFSRYVTHQTMIASGMILTGVGALVMLASPTMIVILFASAMMGAGWAMVIVNLFGHFSERAPLQNSMAYTTAYSQVMAAGTFVGPLVGMILLTLSLPLIPVIIIGGILRIVTGMMIAPAVQVRPIRRRAYATP